MGKQDELLKRLLATFKVEAAEHLQSISSGLAELEREPSSEQWVAIVETVYRDAHSLKGAARAVDLTDIETVCQSMESVFAGFKSREIEPSPGLLEVLYRALDVVGELVAEPARKDQQRIFALIEEMTNQTAVEDESPSDENASSFGESTPHSAATASVPFDTGEKEMAIEGNAPPVPTRGQPVESAERRDTQPLEMKSLASSTVRIPTQRLDSLLLQVEEMLAAKQSARRGSSELMEATAVLNSWTKEWAKIQPDVRKMTRRSWNNGTRERRRNGSTQTVRKLLEFLEWNRSFINSRQDNLAKLSQAAETDARFLDRMVDDLLGDMKQALMLPFSSLLDLFPKMIRDLSRNAGKEIDLVLEGVGVEIDKRILEEIKDPLIHLLRNGVDHGVEKPDRRQTLGKPRRGRIGVTVSQLDSSKVEILIWDDGAGIDADRVKTAAVEKGVVLEEEAGHLDEESALQLIYHSGVTTSPIITDISGRGLGLAIVKEKTDKLGGTISVETRRDAGTSIRILLPLTLSAFRGVVLQTGAGRFIVPTANVERVLRVKRDEIGIIGNQATLDLNGDVISLVKLEDALGLPQTKRPDETQAFVVAVVVIASGNRIAIGVDGILGEQEVLVKNLGRQLSRVRNIAGGTIQSSGEVVPILSVPDLLVSAAGISSSVGDAGYEEPDIQAARSILVVEDSITSRTLLKNILESAGYEVRTTVDGVDAMTTLKTENFDLVVSDVEMPRMDGFELTANIRNDEKLSDMPLILVTSLESREHRERGVDVGANAYIVKSSFDQSNLLETIDRLI